MTESSLDRPAINRDGKIRVTIRAVILDVGGVIVHEQDQVGRSKWEARLGLPSGQLTRLVFDMESAARAPLGQVSERRVWADVGRQFGLTDEQTYELRRDFWSGEHVDTTLVQFITSLRPHYRIAILSNAWSDARSIHNVRFNFSAWVDLAVYSAEVKLVKPDSRIYQLVLSQLDLAAQECIFVDDNLANVHAAKVLGMQGIWYRDTRQTVNDIKECLRQHTAK